MESKLTAIELTGTVNEDHQLQRDEASFPYQSQNMYG
jgi:hypothetical protein